MKVLIRLHRCADWSGLLLSAYAGRHVFAWHDPSNSLLRKLTADGVLAPCVLWYCCVMAQVCSSREDSDIWLSDLGGRSAGGRVTPDFFWFVSSGFGGLFIGSAQNYSKIYMVNILKKLNTLLHTLFWLNVVVFCFAVVFFFKLLLKILSGIGKQYRLLLQEQCRI